MKQQCKSRKKRIIISRKLKENKNLCIKNCILCIITRLIFIYFGPSAAESWEVREIFMHIINIFCIEPKSDVSDCYRRRTVTDLLGLRETFLKVVKISNTFNFSFIRGSQNMNF